MSNEESITNDDYESTSSDEEPNPCGNPLGKTKFEDMNFQQLKDYTSRMRSNKKRYIRKYQLSDKGKAKIKVASKKFYDKNRTKILEKKRLAYLAKKNKLTNTKQ